MGLYELGSLLVFAGMLHTLVKNKDWYKEGQEIIGGIITEYGYPSWLMAVGGVVFFIEYFGGGISLFTVINKAGKLEVDWAAIAGLAAIGLLFLGWWARRDFIRQASFRLKMEVIQDILCSDVIMEPGKAKASIIKFDKLIWKTVLKVREEKQNDDFSLTRHQLDLSINEYLSVIDALVVVTSKCIYLSSDKELEGGSTVFETSVVKLTNIGSSFFYYMKASSEIMDDKEFCVFAASIAVGQGMQESEGKIHELYLGIKGECKSGLIFNELTININKLKLVSRMFLRNHL